MNITNNIQAAGIAAVNKDKQAVVESKAQRIVVAILDQQAARKSNDDAIAKLKVDLNKLAREGYTPASILGSEVTDTGEGTNANTVIKVITKMNADAQASVEAQAKNLVSAIDRLNQNNAVVDKTIADLRKSLSELAVETVTPEAVLAVAN